MDVLSAWKVRTKSSYAEVFGSDDHIKMMVRISGSLYERIEALFIVFKNSSRSYPIVGVPDTFPSVWYWTGLRGWMFETFFELYFI